jgi:hypothetical protein
MQSYSKASNSSASASKFIKTSEWDVQSNRYMQPRTSDRGIKMVSIISNQRNKKLHLQLPMMACWGIEDFTDRETGESDGKFKIKLHFRDDNSDECKEALRKLQAFENQIISDAVANSEAWFGKKLSRELAEDRYFPFLKVGKNKETKEPDASRGHYFSPKVNCYNGKWDLEIFDSNKTMMFPSENESETPIDFVPAGSEVTCGIECKYIWLGAKGWGISWALKQVVVTPKYSDTISGKLQLEVTESEVQEVAQKTPSVAVAVAVAATEKPDNYAENSDDENETVFAKIEPEQESEQEPVLESEPEPEPEQVLPKVKKTVPKKTVEVVPVPDEPVVPVPVVVATKKTVVRKK